MVESLEAHIDGRRDDQRGNDKRQQGRQPQEGEAEHAGERDLVQDAEEDEPVRRRDAGDH